MMEVDKLTKAEAKRLRSELIDAARGEAESWWKLATLLTKVYYSGIGDELAPTWELWGFESFHDLVEMELGLHVTTAREMVRTGNFFINRMNGAWDGQILSRQRMRAIASASHKVDRTNLNEWIRKAVHLSVCELERQLFDRREVRKSVAVQLSQTDAEILKAALDQLMDSGSFANRGEALMSLVRPNSKRLKVA